MLKVYKAVFILREEVMMRKASFRRLSIMLAMLGALALIAVSGLNDWCYAQANQERIRRELPKHMTNSLKHAFAAAELYALLGNILPEPLAASLVLTLGEWNEYAEYTLRPEARIDPLCETSKDLYNNVIGVTLSEWLRIHEPHARQRDRLERLGALAAAGIIPADNRDGRLYAVAAKPVSYREVGEVVRWARGRREAIVEETRKALERR